MPLPVADLRWLTIPRTSDEKGSSVTIKAPQFTTASWQGEITRSLGEIDPTSRMATLIVRVKNPYQLNMENPGPALVQGLFVELELAGSALEDVMIIPRSALHTGDVIWLADTNNRLIIRPVEILRREKDQLIIGHVVNTDERLILTLYIGSG